VDNSSPIQMKARLLTKDASAGIVQILESAAWCQPHVSPCQVSGVAVTSNVTGLGHSDGESQANDPKSRNIVSAPNYQDWQRQSDVFASMALFDSAGNGSRRGKIEKSRERDPTPVSGKGRCQACAALHRERAGRDDWRRRAPDHAGKHQSPKACRRRSAGPRRETICRRDETGARFFPPAWCTTSGFTVPWLRHPAIQSWLRLWKRNSGSDLSRVAIM